MSKTFLDCGAHFGGGLLQLAAQFELDRSWEVHSFEPNEGCRRPWMAKWGARPNFCLHTSAVWIYDGVIQFRSQGLKRGTGKGSTVLPSEDWDFGDNEYAHWRDPVEVTCIDLAAFIQRLPRGLLVLKLDIEGAEFTVVRHLLATDTMKLVNVLVVEWHDKLMKSESVETRKQLAEKVRAAGCEIVLWH
jgi:FkbM family methyltransferase